MTTSVHLYRIPYTLHTAGDSRSTVEAGHVHRLEGGPRRAPAATPKNLAQGPRSGRGGVLVPLAPKFCPVRGSARQRAHSGVVSGVDRHQLQVEALDAERGSRAFGRAVVGDSLDS